jgi:hypothetical protein
MDKEDQNPRTDACGSICSDAVRELMSSSDLPIDLEHQPQEARQDDRRSSPCMLHSTMEREKEDTVCLSPRIVSNAYLLMDDDDDDDVIFSTPLRPRSAVAESNRSKGFLRATPCPSIPSLALSSPILSSPRRRKPGLCRSLAWSQDSQDERLSKRTKYCNTNDDNTSLEQCISWQNTASLKPSVPIVSPPKPTIVHWEEMVSTPMALASALNRAIETTLSN